MAPVMPVTSQVHAVTGMALSSIEMAFAFPGQSFAWQIFSMLTLRSNEYADQFASDALVYQEIHTCSALANVILVLIKLQNMTAYLHDFEAAAKLPEILWQQ